MTTYLRDNERYTLVAVSDLPEGFPAAPRLDMLQTLNVGDDVRIAVRPDGGRWLDARRVSGIDLCFPWVRITEVLAPGVYAGVSIEHHRDFVREPVHFGAIHIIETDYLPDAA